jgi:hypothetical protein
MMKIRHANLKLERAYLPSNVRSGSRRKEDV